jgi:hypothetical protein
MSERAWNAVRREVLERVDVLAEYVSWGFRPTGKANAKGWVPGRAIGREDNTPSAAVGVSGHVRGKYKDLAASLSLSFFYAAAQFCQEHGGDQFNAVKHYAQKLGIALPQGKNEPLTEIPFPLISKHLFCTANPGLQPESLDLMGVYFAQWNTRLNGAKQNVVVFPVYDETGAVCGNVLMASSGKLLPVPQKNGAIEERRKHTVKGSKSGWVNKYAIDRLLEKNRVVEVVWKVEGITDAAAMQAFIPPQIRERHIVVTNSSGAGEFPKEPFCDLLGEVRAYVLHDADKPGEAGANLWSQVLGRRGVEGGHVRLPYPVEEKHGKDLRDWINEGHSYQDLLSLADKAEPFRAGSAKAVVVDFASVESIYVNNRQLHDVTREAITSLEVLNIPPTLFVREGRLTQVVEGEGGLSLDSLDEAQVRERLSRTARWLKTTTQGDEDVFPPREIAQNILAHASLPFPVIHGVTKAPVFDPRGGLNLNRGYCPETKLWNDFDQHVHLIEKPSPQDVADARSLIVEDLLYDFPFHDKASLAGAVEFMLRPFARQMIDGPTPLTLVHAPTERTGKGLLLDVLTTPFLGEPASVSSVPEEDDEMRKRITANLVSGHPIFILDNLPERKMVNLPSLASLLTGVKWDDRILGQTKKTRLPATACWAATGNNPRLSSELCGRSVSVRLLSLSEDPSQRKGFKHPLLASWARQNRWAFVDAALTLIQAWVSQGKPQGLQTLGRYESWAGVMGGILDVAGIYGLLDNRSDFMDRTNEVVGNWVGFIRSWWDQKGTTPCTVGELADVANGANMLWEVLGEGSDRSQATRLGKAIGRMVDRVFDEKMIVQFMSKHQPARMYRLVEVKTLQNTVNLRSEDKDDDQETVVFS